MQELDDVEKFVKGAASAAGHPQATVHVTAAKTKVARLENAAKSQQMEYLRAAHAEAGEWARHFSIVRMTVPTFLIGISIGIVAFAWDKPNLGGAVLMLMAWVVWVLMVILMYRFTQHMLRRSNQQRLNSAAIEDAIGLHLSDLPASVLKTRIVAIDKKGTRERKFAKYYPQVSADKRDTKWVDDFFKTPLHDAGMWIVIAMTFFFAVATAVWAGGSIWYGAMEKKDADVRTIHWYAPPISATRPGTTEQPASR